MDEKYKQDFIKAGALAGEVRAYGKSLIMKGASYHDVIAKINHKITALGARPAFPPQIALDNVAAHYLPDPAEEIIFADQVVKLDVGVCVNGAIGDCAVTIDLSGKHQSLLEAVEAALLAAENSVEIGKSISDIGKIIEEKITSYGFKPIKNLSGHGLGFYKIHTPPLIPNYKDGSIGIIKPGMTFAIEPFATNGRGYIHESGIPTIFSLKKSLPVRTPLSRTLLRKMQSFNGLPFAIHDFIGDEFTLSEVKEGFTDLMNAGVIDGYRPLIEETNALVAQAENSVLIDKKGTVYITTR